jgi:hypothetical protein
LDSRHFEELTLNAWPPLQTLLYDGWLLGFSGGYTRRANSVQPLYPSTLPLAEKIAECEATYAARCIPLTFKITSSAADPSWTQRSRSVATRSQPRQASKRPTSPR